MTERLRITADWGYASFPGPRIETPALLVDGARIVAFGRADEVPDPDARSIAVEGGIIPGFIDAHVHLHFDGGPDPIESVRAASDDELATLAERNAALLLSAGVTTARDLGSRGTALTGLRDAIRDGAASGPDLVVAGAPLTTPDGHVWFLGGGCSNATELVAHLNRQADAGVDVVKIVASGGFLTAGTSTGGVQFGSDELRAVVAAAHQRGMQVAAHAHSSAAIAAAASAGVDSIEHATFIRGDSVAVDESAVAAMVAGGVAICPTVNCATSSYPAEYGTDALRRLRDLHRSGVPILMGTDAGVAGVTGDRYADGLVELVTAGFSPAEVLAFATTSAAQLLGLADRGELRPGARADAVALDADPIDAIDATRAVGGVLAGGRWTPSEARS